MRPSHKDVRMGLPTQPILPAPKRSDCGRMVFKAPNVGGNHANAKENITTHPHTQCLLTTFGTIDLAIFIASCCIMSSKKLETSLMTAAVEEKCFFLLLWLLAQSLMPEGLMCLLRSQPLGLGMRFELANRRNHPGRSFFWITNQRNQPILINFGISMNFLFGEIAC